ncbi:MAG: hypothetical protein IJT88_05230 [Kiritimatiellae bacterium]|nr:hypothetical protein [Kiritimatiellia bacterium]
MAFFASFLRASGLFERLVAGAPFEYASPNAPDVRNVVGTMVLSILAGHKRHCHIGCLRNDAACAELLGLTKIVSDESVRRALAKCDEAKLGAWLLRFERETTEALLQVPYVIDIDSTVKPSERMNWRRSCAMRGFIRIGQSFWAWRRSCSSWAFRAE